MYVMGYFQQSRHMHNISVTIVLSKCYVIAYSLLFSNCLTSVMLHL